MKEPHTRTPHRFYQVSRGQFSVARHYGSLRFGGDYYIYVPSTDELVRDDVLKWEKKRKEVDQRESL